MALQVRDLALSLLWGRFDYLALEFPHAVGTANKQNKQTKMKEKKPLFINARLFI